MKHSFFVRRQLLLVIATILVTSVLISIVFNIVARSVFVREKAAEYTDNVRDIAKLYLRYDSGNLSQADYEYIMEETANWDGSLAIFTMDGVVHTMTSDVVKDPISGIWYKENKSDEEQSVVKTVRPYVDTVLSGTPVAILGKWGITRTGNIVIGMPVYVEGNDDVIAAVFMTRRIAELNAALDSFNLALSVSILGVLLVMLFPTYIGAVLLAKPLHQMRDVALRMARGDFSAKANASVRGEIGELGTTLNFLSERLSSTIQELRLEKNRLASIVDGLGEGILAVDAQGEITHINPALLRIFRPRALSVGAWDRTQLIPDEALWNDFEMTISERTPMVRNMKWGAAELAITITPLEDENGMPKGAVGLFRDVTEQIRLEQTRRDYVANVSHELRTPVSSVRGLAEALNDGLIKTDEDRQRYYGFILRETMRLTRLIEDLLELSRLQSGTVALKKTQVDVRELLIDFAERYAQTAEEVNIDFALDMPDDCPHALTNADRVEQVLIVLVDNAIKFTPSGGHIRVSASPQGQFIRLSVSDSGSGIEPDDLPHVFERFFKADRAHTGQGTGLGLSIASEIVQLLGGKLTVNSELGVGSEFSFTVPVYAR